MSGKRNKALRRLAKMYAEARNWPKRRTVVDRKGNISIFPESEEGWYRLLKKELKEAPTDAIVRQAVRASQLQRELDLGSIDTFNK